MSCDPPITFSKTHSFVGTSGITITIVVPEIYPCTNIQLRLRDSGGIVIEDWFDYAVVATLSTTINFTFPLTACFLDIRLNKCCSPPLDPPPPPSDDPPCSLIAPSEDECSAAIAITDPYIKPADSSVSTPINEISIPKKVLVKITQNSCSDIEATLCTVRCSPPVPTPPPPPTGKCPCRWVPVVDIYSLPSLPIGRLPYGVPIDFDCLCNYEGGLRLRPSFGPPTYHTVKAYFQPSYGLAAIPFIDGVGYDTTNLNHQTYVKVAEFTNNNTNVSSQFRSWLTTSFRFFGLNESKTDINFVWPYTDLYWTPYDYCTPNNFFNAEPGVAYVILIPC